MATDSGNGPDLSILSPLESAVGSRFLAYMLSCDAGSLAAVISGETPLTDKQAEIVRQIAVVWRSIPPELEAATVKEAVRSWLTRPGEGADRRSVVKRAHEYISGPEPTLDVEDELERAIAELALDAYPAFLLTPDERLPARPFSIMTTVAIAGPARTKFCDAALLEPVFKQLFGKYTRHGGYSGMLHTNTGSSGGLQLLVLPEVLLQTAWKSLDGSGPSPQAFATGAIKELAFARAVLAGETRMVSVRVAFAGILLPDGAQLDLGNGDVVRPITELDRRYAMDLGDMGKASYTDPSGKSVTINYDGNLVLVHQFPYRVRIGKAEEDTFDDWYDDAQPHAMLQRVVTRLRFSLMLALEREHRVQIVEAWRYFDQPLSQGMSMSIGDPRQSTGLVATQLTEEEVKAWSEWYRRLNSPYVDRIDVALTRILRAASERREPSDLLIDSVIAWENLFGTREGEPTFRVTACLAVLLEQTPQARRDLRTRLGKIYGLRSKVVHGNENLKRSEYPMCHEALDIAIRAIRVLVTDRSDVLELPDGGDRSVALLVGA